MADVIPATFSDFKLIRGRKVAQLVLEIPIEKAQEALSVLGMPIPGQELWCAVARLKSEPVLTTNTTKAPSGPAPSTAKPKQKWSEMRPSAQAALRCDDTEFQEYVRTEFVHHREDPAEAVRSWCGVKSRAELDKNDRAAMAWAEMEENFQEWRGTQRAQQQHEAYAR